MRFATSILILILLMLTSTFSQSYKYEIKGKSAGNGFFTPNKTFEIRKMQAGTYSLNNFYVKSSSKVSEVEFKKFIVLYLSQKGYQGLNISKISKPFDKFIISNLLNNSSSYLENIFQIQIENKFEIFDLCSLLTESNEVEYAVPMIFYEFDEFRPNDPDLELQWALESVDLFKAWDIAKGDKSIIVGIIDSGVDINHEDLATQVWINADEIPDDGIDNDNNGFIDDVHGWDFVGDINHQDAIQGNFKEDNNVIPEYRANDHGTHVAGISAAKSNNALGIASTGFDITFLPVKIGVDDLSKSRIVYRPYEAMLYAANNGADVINCSWSSTIHDPLAEDVVNEILSKGIMVVAAAGNENSYTDDFPYYPANIEGVISVGSVSSQSKKSYFSNYGVKLSCFAPGESLYSTITDNRYSNKSGTSMATPFVAGIVSTMTKIFPKYSNKQIIKQIRSTSTPFNPFTYFTYGIINAFEAYRNNNPNFPANKSKGIGLDGIQIAGNGAIANYGNTDIKFIIKNYLSDLDQVKISIIPQDNYFSFSSSSVTLTNLKVNESREVVLTFNLDKTCPWFDGDAKFLITYESDNYKEYELMSIPIFLETNNRYQLVQNILEDVEIQWLDSDTFTEFDYWAVGYDFVSNKSLLYNFGKLNRLVPISSDVVTSVSAADNSNIMLTANGKGSVVKVMKSSNSGSTFNSVDLSSEFSFLSGVQYYNSKNAFIYGINSQGTAEIAYSNNDGLSFTKSVMNFVLQSNETISTDLAERNKIAYLATSLGKIIKSDDFGESWYIYSDKLSDSVVHIAVINDDSLFVITKKNGIYSLQSSQNGGKDFTKLSYNLTELGKTLFLLVPQGSNSVYLFESTGKLYYSNNMGQSWEAELSYMYKFYDINTASLFVKNGKARLWWSGFDINYLDFNVVPAKIIRNIAIAGKNELKFDTLDIGKFEEEIIFIENKGNIRSSILTQSLVNGDAFELSEPFKSTISPSELISGTVKFKPETVGYFSDTLVIESDADSIPLKFILSGNAVDPTTVHQENELFNNIRLLSLSSNQFAIEIYSEIDFAFNVLLYDVSGRVVDDFGSFRHQSGMSYTFLKNNKHTSGVYLLGIANSNFSKLIKLIISE